MDIYPIVYRGKIHVPFADLMAVLEEVKPAGCEFVELDILYELLEDIRQAYDELPQVSKVKEIE